MWPESVLQVLTSPTEETTIDTGSIGETVELFSFSRALVAPLLTWIGHPLPKRGALI
jgi:predicted MFS family arabinose efflux permease